MAKKQIEERRADATREGAQRYTMIIEKQYVNFLRNYNEKTGTRITDMVNDALKHWVERIRTGKQKY
jgi:hypothetical protein